MSDRTLHRGRKNATEDVRVTISTFKGAVYSSIQVHYEAAPGVWHPTRKGLTIALDLLPERNKPIRELLKAAAS